MNRIESYLSGPDAYDLEADALLDALNAGEDEALWLVKWMHPGFRGRSVDEVRSAELSRDDARLVVAQHYGFNDWSHLTSFTEAVRTDEAVARFESAVDAIVSGDLYMLRPLLREHPDLIRARSSRRHRATLLHYIAANGVEDVRQKTPENAVDVARLLLECGAEVDALADMYDEKCTTMSMLVSSSPPAEAGLQGALAETLIDHGAALNGRGSKWQSALTTALAFGFLDTARILARRGAAVDSVAAAAGLGLPDEVKQLLPASNSDERHAALALAAQLGHPEVVALLLDAGEDPDRFNPEGLHAHSTPLHQAIAANHIDVVRLLAERGARLDIKDTIFSGTPLGWAIYLGRQEIADYLRAKDAAAS